MRRFLYHRLVRSAARIWLLLAALLLTTSSANAQTVDWAKTFGRDWGISQIVTDSQGNTYACGNFRDTVTIGAFTLYAADSSRRGYSDVLVAKFDAAGTCQWVAQAGGESSTSSIGSDYVADIALDPSGNVIVVGKFSSYSAQFGAYTLNNAGPNFDLFVAKLNGVTGQWLWASRAGGPGEEAASALKIDASGDAYVSGNFRSATCQVGSTTLTRLASRDLLVAKLNGATGQWQWANRAGVGYGAGNSLALDGRGHCFVAGMFRVTAADFGATTLTTYITGSGANLILNTQCFVARMSATTGAWQWAAQGGDSNRQYGGAEADFISVDGQGMCTVMGTIFDCRSVQIGPSTLVNNSGTRVNSSPPYNLIVLRDLFVARLDSAGQWLSAASYGGIGDEYSENAFVGANGLIHVVGSLTESSFNLGTKAVQSIGQGAFLASYDPVVGNWLDASTIVTFASQTPGNRIAGINADRQGNWYIAGGFYESSMQLCSLNLLGLGTVNEYTGFLARLNAGPLSTDAPLLSIAHGLTVWPNPTSHTVHISGAEAGQTVHLLDAHGRLIIEAKVPADGQLDLAPSVAHGLYFVRVVGTRQSQRLVVEKAI
jgi:hypothetical protein